MTCTDVLHGLDAWLLGALEPVEAGRLAAHLEECPACMAEAEARRRSVEQLALTAPLRRAPPALRDAIMTAIGSGSRPIPFPTRRPAEPGQTGAGIRTGSGGRHAGRWTGWSSTLRHAGPYAIAALLVVAVGFLSYRMTSLQAQVSSLQRASSQAGASAIAPRFRDAVLLLTQSGTVTAPLSWQGTGVAATGAVIWNPTQKQCLLLARELEPAPPGYEYHVWFRSQDGQWDGGALPVDGGGEGGTMISMAGWDTGYGYHVTISLQKQGDGAEARPILGGDVAQASQ